MMTVVENLPSIILSIIFTLGFLWLFYPAWAVLIAESLEWEVELLSSPRTKVSEFPVSPTLSLVIPAYNEEERIPIMIHESFNYLISARGQEVLRRLQACAQMKATTSVGSQRSDDIQATDNDQSIKPAPTVEWLIINDGSKDSTCDSVREVYKNLAGRTNRSDTSGDNMSPVSLASDWDWKIVSLKRNGGKGAAVKTGMNVANGMFHLMVDADGATDFENGLENLTQELERFLCSNNSENNVDPMIAIFGSRAHLQQESTAKRSFVRTLLMKAFHFFVSLFVSSTVHDTQCGFKLFSRSASDVVFQALHLRRWAFDTEIVLVCCMKAIKICEVAVPWKEVDGSKLSTSKLALALVSLSMLRDMICVRACYTLGIWSVETRYNSRKNS